MRLLYSRATTNLHETLYDWEIKMEGCQTVDLIVASSRAVVLIIATIAGIISIVLGWKLYKDVILSKTEGSLKAGSWTIKLAGAGPGVFFVGFGVWLLVKIVGQQVELDIADIGKLTSTSHSDIGKFANAHIDLPHRISQIDRSSKPLLISDDKCPGVSACPVCLVPKSHVIRFFDGPKVLTSEMAREALKTAEQSLELQAMVPQAASSPLAAVNLGEQIEVLKQMRLLIPSSTGD